VGNFCPTILGNFSPPLTEAEAADVAKQHDARLSEVSADLILVFGRSSEVSECCVRAFYLAVDGHKQRGVSEHEIRHIPSASAGLRGACYDFERKTLRLQHGAEQYFYIRIKSCLS
jgi:hypothetical protein